MPQKIKADKEYPFYQAYHDVKYILRHDCSKDVPLREPKESRTYRFLNKAQKEIVVYHVDAGIIKNDNISKCDYGIFTEDDTLFLIELKGSDQEHAIDQINSTIKHLLDTPKVKVKKVNARVVLSRVRVPRIATSSENKLKQMLFKRYGGGTYKKQTRNLEEIY